MALTYGNLKQHILLALGGQPSIVSGVTRDQRIAEIINQAGNYLFSKQWRFRERTSRPLSVVASQDYISLPSDVDELVTLTCKAGLGWVVEMTTPEQMEILRTAIEPGLMAGTYYAALSRPWAQSNGSPLVDGTGMPEIRLELYPKPASSSSDSIFVRYRSAWVALNENTLSTYLIPVPSYAEALLIAYARAFAMAYEDEGLSARLIEIDNGPLFNNASIKDGIQQRDYGRLPTQRVGPFRRGSGSVSSGYGSVGALLAPATAFSNIRWRGVWSGASTYTIGDVIRYGDKVYIAVIGSTNSTPPSSSWELMTQDGQVGPIGPTGATGATGPMGTLPAINEGSLIGRATGLGNGVPVGVPAGYGLGVLADVAVSLTMYSSTLSSNVAMTNAVTWYDGPSISLTAGTYSIDSTVTLRKGSLTGTSNYAVRITDGTNHFCSTESSWNTRASSNGTASCSSRIVLASTTTIKIQAISDYAGGQILAATDFQSSGANATNINALRIA